MNRTSLRQRLFIVVAAAVVPLAVMSAVALYAGYQQQRAQAERAGLVSRVVAADQLQAEAMAVAQKIAGYSLPLVLKIK